MNLFIFDILCIHFSQRVHTAVIIFKHITHIPSVYRREKVFHNEYLYIYSIIFLSIALDILVWAPPEAGSETRI